MLRAPRIGMVIGVDVKFETVIKVEYLRSSSPSNVEIDTSPFG